MNSLMDEVDPDEPRSGTDLTLGIGSLLSIFFGVVLICGIFFGFGYSMGRRNAHVPAALTALTNSGSPASVTKSDTPAADTDTVVTHEQSDDSSAKPSIPAATPEPASPTAHPAPAPAASEPSSAPAAKAAVPEQHTASAKTAPEPPKTPAEPKTTRVVEPAVSNPALTAVPYAHRPTLPAKPHAGFATIPDVNAGPQPDPTPGHPVMVQIAAVSREEDAQTLAGALRKRGFSPSVRPGTGDKFFHVQVGPFTNKTDAESMKQHLLADGYNAILK